MSSGPGAASVPGAARLAVLAAGLLAGGTAPRGGLRDQPRQGMDWSNCLKERSCSTVRPSSMPSSGRGPVRVRLRRLRPAPSGTSVARNWCGRRFRKTNMAGANLEKVLASRATFAGRQPQRGEARQGGVPAGGVRRRRHDGRGLLGRRLPPDEFPRAPSWATRASSRRCCPGSDFRGAALAGATMKGAYLYRARLDAVDLTKSRISSRIRSTLPAGPPKHACRRG